MRLTNLYERAKHHLGRLGHRLALVCCAGLGGLILSAPAFAGPTITLSSFPPNPNVLPGGGWQFTPGTTFGNPTPPRAWVNGVYGSVPEVVATDSVAIAGRAGPLAVQVSEGLTMDAALATVARCVGSPVCVAATGAALYVGSKLYDKYRIHPDPNGPGLKMDPGQPPGVGDSFRCSTPYGDGYGPNSGSACAEAQKLFPTTQTYESDSYDYEGVVSGICSSHCITQWQSTRFFYSDSQHQHLTGQGTSIVQGNVFPNGTALTCPHYQDANGADVTPPIGPDGLCPTGSYTQPISDTQASAKIAPTYVSPTQAQLDQLTQAVRDAITNGQSAPASITVTGPTSQQGTPVQTTTTTSSGTTTQTQTPTYTYHYDGDTITYDTSSTTITTNYDGSTTTTTTTEPGVKPQDPKDPCTANPDRIGCMSLGAPPTDAMPKNTKNLSWTAEDPGFGATCPAAESIPTSHGQILVNFEAACNTATKARPWIVAGGYFAALMIVIAALRGN